LCARASGPRTTAAAHVPLELRALSQQFARDLLELFAIVLLGVALTEPSPVDVANVGFAWIGAELGAGRKMLNLIRTNRKLLA
jgi:hypothetical protein